MPAYKDPNSSLLRQHLPHRDSFELAEVAERLGWPSWEDCPMAQVPAHGLQPPQVPDDNVAELDPIHPYWPLRGMGGRFPARRHRSSRRPVNGQFHWPVDGYIKVYAVSGLGGSGGVVPLAVPARSFVVSRLVPTICLSMKS